MKYFDKIFFCIVEQKWIKTFYNAVLNTFVEIKIQRENNPENK